VWPFSLLFSVSAYVKPYGKGPVGKPFFWFPAMALLCSLAERFALGVNKLSFSLLFWFPLRL
jgi:hypothetical protein